MSLNLRATLFCDVNKQGDIQLLQNSEFKKDYFENLLLCMSFDSKTP